MNATFVSAPQHDLIQQLVEHSSTYAKMGDLSLHSNSEQTFAIVIQEKGQIIGGAVATINLDWAYVGLLWVDDSLRGQGAGRRLMMAVESYVHQQGLNGVYLYTIDFQAPEFYRKIGYEVMGTLSNRPQGHTATYYSKTDLVTNGLTDDLTIETPVKDKTAKILEAGLDSHATEIVAPVVGYDRLFSLQDENGVIQGGLLGHEFWGWLEVHLCYATTSDGINQLLDTVESFCDEYQLGIEMATYEAAQSNLLQQRGYQRWSVLQDRPTGKTCTFWIRPQSDS